MEITLEEFQEAANGRTVAPGVKPKPYSAAQREFAVQYARRAMASGSSKSAILQTLGISDGALRKWMLPKDSIAGRGFRRVRLNKEVGTHGGLTILTPEGYRVEGLTPSSAAVLLKALG